MLTDLLLLCRTEQGQGAGLERLAPGGQKGATALCLRSQIPWQKVPLHLVTAQ